MTKHNECETVSELVDNVLKKISEPYPENITDQVCLAIQKDWIDCYERLVNNHSKRAVNSQIGHSTLQKTGLKNLGLRATATSKLIKTFSRLGKKA